MSQDRINNQRKSLIQQYLKTEEDLEFLGNGAFGSAFLYKGKVYKITSDVDDYLTAKQLIRKGKKFKHFVKIYSTRLVEAQLTDSMGHNYNMNLYIIVSEYVKPFYKSHEKDEITRELWRNFARYNNDWYILKGEAKPTKNIPEIEKNDPVMVDYLYNQMCSVYNELIRLGYRNWDNHAENWGFKDGVIKIFDCGCANKPERQRYNKKRKIVLTSHIAY